VQDYDHDSVLLELYSVSKAFGPQKVVDQVSLRLKAGRVLCLLGPSGVGKSTLLEIMAGLTKPDSGKVEIKTPPSLLFQDNLLIPWLNALANITYILPKTLSLAEAEKRARFWLKTFDLEQEKYPQAMSGGMKRRLALARTLAADRSLIILDEPFAFLDRRWGELITDLVILTVNKGSAVVLAGHSRPDLLAKALPDRLDIVEISGQPVRLNFF
jgi:NitT/TauT family transport system ATP-binding protein